VPLAYFVQVQWQCLQQHYQDEWSTETLPFGYGFVECQQISHWTSKLKTLPEMPLFYCKMQLNFQFYSRGI